jgi:hypothetical protein
VINMEVPIQLPQPARRSGGLFVDVATPIDTMFGGRDRLGAGVVHVPWGCDPMFLGNAEICMVDGETVTSVEDGIDIGATDLVSKDNAIRSYPDQVVHPPFKVVDGLECGVLSFPHDTTPSTSISNRLRARMALQISKMMMAELVAGAVSGGPSLQSEATALTATTGIYGAAFYVESWLASVLHNGIGAVVLPVGFLPLAVESGWVNASTMTTQSGHKVIADAGFTGDPNDPTDPAPATFSIFGMGLPGHAYSSPKILDVVSGSSHVDITDDTIRQINEAYAQIAFDPCAVGQTIVDLDFDSFVLAS